MKATLILSGKPDRVLAVVQLAIEEKIVETCELDATAENLHPARKDHANGLAIGDRIATTSGNTAYNVEKGDIGKVVDIKTAGQGKTVRVKWEDGTESPIAASLLKKVRK